MTSPAPLGLSNLPRSLSTCASGYLSLFTTGGLTWQYLHDLTCRCREPVARSRFCRAEGLSERDERRKDRTYEPHATQRREPGHRGADESPRGREPRACDVRRRLFLGRRGLVPRDRGGRGADGR